MKCHMQKKQPFHKRSTFYTWKLHNKMSVILFFISIIEKSDYGNHNYSQQIQRLIFFIIICWSTAVLFNTEFQRCIPPFAKSWMLLWSVLIKMYCPYMFIYSILYVNMRNISWISTFHFFSIRGFSLMQIKLVWRKAAVVGSRCRQCSWVAGRDDWQLGLLPVSLFFHSIHSSGEIVTLLCFLFIRQAIQSRTEGGCSLRNPFSSLYVHYYLYYQCYYYYY